MGDTAGASIPLHSIFWWYDKENFICKGLRGTFQGTSVVQLLRTLVNSLL